MLLGVDVGGTFTDAAVLTADGLVTAKAPSTPRDQSEGVLAAVSAALDAAGADAADVERFVHGMTVGTNALLEGRVARTALLATEGFTDLEELGRQARPELYRLCAGHPPPLVPPELRVPVPERTGPDGVLRALDEDVLRERARKCADIEAAAVCLLWGFRHREHEQAVAALLERELPRVHVSTSHETAGVFREYERCATTVVGAARSGERAGVPDVVCLDMGGTSCDVSVAFGGRAGETGGREVGGRALALPMVDVHTIGAGGGSVAWRDAGGALRVGPRSAGAEPGPACYGRGGDEPTGTDANLLLGYLGSGSPLAAGGEGHDSRARHRPARTRPLGVRRRRSAPRVRDRRRAGDANRRGAAGVGG